MPLISNIFSSSLSRRLLAAMALLAAVLLLATAANAVRDLRVKDERQALEILATQSRSYASELRARLAASELVVQTAGRRRCRPAGSLLRARIVRSEIIHGVVVSGSARASGPVPLSSADHTALSAGPYAVALRAAPQ